MTAFDVLVETDGRLVVSYRIQSRVYRAVTETGVPPVYPVDIRDGCARIEVTATEAALSALVDALEAAGASVDVRAISRGTDSATLLTDRQWDVLRTAYEAGYYDSPRRCSTADLADAVGVAPSTASDILRRAERRALGAVLDGSVP